MAAELLYLASYKNVAELFQRIATARQPEVFTQRYLSETIGLKGAGDRGLIALLKALGFLDGAGRPTVEYGALKNPAKAKAALGRAIRHAYEPLYEANEKAHDLDSGELKGLISQVAGSDSSMTSKIMGTFTALTKLAEFVDNQEPASSAEDMPPIDEGNTEKKKASPIRPEFHYNIQVHLPVNATEETYLSIFNALRKSFS